MITLQENQGIQEKHGENKWIQGNSLKKLIVQIYSVM